MRLSGRYHQYGKGNILAATDMSHKLTGEELLEMVRG